MNADVLNAINVQINSEFSAWYQYLAMAAFCEREQFTGAARWLQAQSVEEYQHGMKLFNFVLARNGIVQLTTIEQPTRDSTPSATSSSAPLQQEDRVTGQINGPYDLASRSKAFAEITELQWFLDRAGGGGENRARMVAKFRLVGDDPGSLLDLDRELGTAQREPGACSPMSAVPTLLVDGITPPNAHALFGYMPVWSYFLLAFVDTHITTACVTLYLHRCQTHRAIAFQCPSGALHALLAVGADGDADQGMGGGPPLLHRRAPSIPTRIRTARSSTASGGAFSRHRSLPSGPPDAALVEQYGKGTPDDSARARGLRPAQPARSRALTLVTNAWGVARGPGHVADRDGLDPLSSPPASSTGWATGGATVRSTRPTTRPIFGGQDRSVLDLRRGVAQQPPSRPERRQLQDEQGRTGPGQQPGPQHPSRAAARPNAPGRGVRPGAAWAGRLAVTPLARLLRPEFAGTDV